MSPIEYIKEGIRQGNWETVCEGYERLTGEIIPLPTTTTNNAEVILQQIIDIVSSTHIDCDIKPPTKKKPGRLRGDGKKRVEKKVTVNKDGEDSSILLSDRDRTTVQKDVGTTQLITNDPDPTEVEANKAKAKRASRNKLKLNRKTTTTYEVKCNECDNSFQSTRPKGEMGQKCPECLIGLKGRFI